jgi:acetoin:2,6-dichlorophenolindophenol oxidoreductase subunit beta
MEAADELALAGVSCEIVDLRTLAPLDLPTICESVARTGALLTLEEGQITCGVGAEVAFRVRESLGASRDLRVGRVGALAAPVSSNPVLEDACVPDAGRVVDAIRQLLS